MKLLLDFLPILLFFMTFKVAEGRAEQAAQFTTEHFGAFVSGGVVGATEAPVLLATVVVILATLAQVLFLKLRGQKVDTMLWVSLGLITVLGGATVWFHNETFIKWKPTVLYWVMASAFLLSPIVAGKNLLRAMLGAQIELPAFAWQRLNLAWVGFFAFMGALNLWVAFNFSTSTWATFKAFGGMGLMLVFMLAQGVYMHRHMVVDEAQADPAKADGS
jgi:intracellular septation protein